MLCSKLRSKHKWFPNYRLTERSTDVQIFHVQPKRHLGFPSVPQSPGVTPNSACRLRSICIIRAKYRVFAPHGSAFSKTGRGSDRLEIGMVICTSPRLSDRAQFDTMACVGARKTKFCERLARSDFCFSTSTQIWWWDEVAQRGTFSRF